MGVADESGFGGVAEQRLDHGQGDEFGVGEFGCQKRVLGAKIVQRMGERLDGKTIALWGLAFKPETDDMRDAPSRVLIEELLRRGARVQAYDPVAAPEAARVMPAAAGLRFADSAQAALHGADALAIVTEWREFRTPDFSALRAALRVPLVFDGRNLYDPGLMARHGIEYHSIGRSLIDPRVS